MYQKNNNHISGDMPGIIKLVRKTSTNNNDIYKKKNSSHGINESIIVTMIKLVEYRDVTTGKHLGRCSHTIDILIKGLLERNIYVDELNMLNLDLIVASSRLHDIGKLKIHDDILLKRGKLNAHEYELMKKHVEHGIKILEKIQSATISLSISNMHNHVLSRIINHSQRRQPKHYYYNPLTYARAIKQEDEFLFYARKMISTHHEKWNGTGYPNKLAGYNIPLCGRLMAIADVYDALAADRPYRKAIEHREAVKIISANSGKQFDPALIEVFLSVADKFNDFAMLTNSEYSDANTEMSEGFAS